jgi:hypothetical protein
LRHQIGHNLENIHGNNQADWVAGGDQAGHLLCLSRGRPRSTLTL